MKKYFTYSGNNLVNAELPDDATILYPRPPMPGISKREMPKHIVQAFDNPLGMPPLRELVDSNSKILIAFDDNCQPFPATAQPDIRQIMIETLLEMLYSYGVKKENIELMCAVALHRKMKPAELAWMMGKRIMAEFYPHRLVNFDAEDPDDIVVVGQTEHGEAVETTRKVVESDLVIYVDSIQIPLNGGHKSVAVGMGTYVTILDLNPARLRYVHDILGEHVAAVMSNRANIEEEVTAADLVISPALVPGARAPKLLTRSLFQNMRSGAALLMFQ